MPVTTWAGHAHPMPADAVANTEAAEAVQNTALQVCASPPLDFAMLLSPRLLLVRLQPLRLVRLFPTQQSLHLRQQTHLLLLLPPLLVQELSHLMALAAT
jgi:hypothetical protein